MTWAKINYVYICQCLDSLLLLYNISIVVTTQKKIKLFYQQNCPIKKVKESVLIKM